MGSNLFTCVAFLVPLTVGCLLSGVLISVCSASSSIAYGDQISVNQPEEFYIFTSNSRAASLPTTIEVTDISIIIRPDYQDALENTSEFDGDVDISFRVTTQAKSIDKIILHAGVNVSNVAVKDKAGTNLPVSAYNTAGDTSILTITMKSNLTSGTTSKRNSYNAHIIFSGKFQDDTRGFYKSTYKKEYGKTGVLFTTHFQPVHARKAFPCFDEPNFKNSFQLTIEVPSGYDALSNTPIETRQSISRVGRSVTRISFKKTPIMSSYLVAFVVYEISSFVPTHIVISDDVAITTWARKNAVYNRLTDYSQDITFKILRHLEEFTGIPYKGKMDKIDQVAMPDFAAGAMENWGLIIYRESRLLYNDTRDSEATKKSVAAIIAHELSHQWFGNLVTTKWWDTTWLNEGFARFLQYFILNRIHPSWRMMDQILLDQQMSIFVADSLSSSLHLNHDVTTAQEISGQFGTLTYSKGASIVRMINYIMGDQNFEAGLRQYLSGSLTSVTPDNLYTALQNHLPAERKPTVSFGTAMDSWASQAGFPVIHIERDYYTKTATINQSRFFTDGTVEKEPTLYHVPITWTSKYNSTLNFLWLSERNISLRGLPEMEYWFLVHANGYYRVNYDEGNWITLAYTLANQQTLIAPADRAKLVDDALALARVGLLPYRILSYLLRYLPQEKDVLPWGAANRGMEFLDKHLTSVDTSGDFYKYVEQATANAYEALSGFSQRGDAPELLLRGSVLRWACRAGNADCLKQAAHLLVRFLNYHDPLDSNLDEIILCYGARGAKETVWEDLWVAYKRSLDSTERSSFLKALGCIEDRERLFRFFRRVAAEPEGETRRAFAAALSHPKGIAAALDFVTENIAHMRIWLKEEEIEGILNDITDQLTSQEQYRKISVFFEEQIETNVINEKFADDLKEKVKRNVEYVRTFSEDALKAFSDATSKGIFTFPPLQK